MVPTPPAKQDSSFSLEPRFMRGVRHHFLPSSPFSRFSSLVRDFCWSLRHGSSLRPPIVPFLAFLPRMVCNFAAFLFVPAKDHLAGSGLQHTRHRGFNRLANHLSRVIDNNHGPVVQIRDAL